MKQIRHLASRSPNPVFYKQLSQGKNVELGVRDTETLVKEI